MEKESQMKSEQAALNFEKSAKMTAKLMGDERRAAVFWSAAEVAWYRLYQITGDKKAADRAAVAAFMAGGL